MSELSTAERINDLRQRYLNGEPWHRDELRDAIEAMCGDRLREVQNATTKKSSRKPTTPPPSLDDLL